MTRILDLVRGASTATVRLNKLTCRTRANAFDWPSLSEWPAASTAIRSPGFDAPFIAIMVA